MTSIATAYCSTALVLNLEYSGESINTMGSSPSGLSKYRCLSKSQIEKSERRVPVDAAKNAAI